MNNEYHPGLVISYFGSKVAVEDSTGTIYQCHLHRNQELPVVGDKVEWQLNGDNTGTIIKILPRQSLLSKGDSRGKSKPLAANIDVFFVIMAPQGISEYLIDRYLAAAELLKILPVIVLNKTDLLSTETEKALATVLKPYREVPYPVILSSILTKNGLDQFISCIKHKTGVLVGPSGVGKSSIIAALANTAIRIGEVTAKGTGKHTTTATRLYHLPHGANLIDSPGVREFNLWRIDRRKVIYCFPEFAVYAVCRFRDCAHMAEPDCGIRQAVAANKISPQRYHSYQMFMKEMDKNKNG